MPISVLTRAVISSSYRQSSIPSLPLCRFRTRLLQVTNTIRKDQEHGSEIFEKFFRRYSYRHKRTPPTSLRFDSYTSPFQILSYIEAGGEWSTTYKPSFPIRSAKCSPNLFQTEGAHHVVTFLSLESGLRFLLAGCLLLTRPAAVVSVPSVNLLSARLTDFHTRSSFPFGCLMKTTAGHKGRSLLA